MDRLMYVFGLFFFCFVSLSYFLIFFSGFHCVCGMEGGGVVYGLCRVCRVRRGCMCGWV